MADQKEIEKLKTSLNALEQRISRLEASFSHSKSSDYLSHTDDSFSEANDIKKEKGSIESKIGEYGMAWIGNIVLLLGILFLLQILKIQDQVLLSGVIGYASVLGIYLLGYYSRKQLPYMSKLFTYNGHLLLFIVSLGLHFFTENPIVTNKAISVILLLGVIAVLTFLSFKQGSQILSGLVMIMLVITAISSNATHIMLPLMIVITVLSIYVLYKFAWKSLLILAIILVYLTFLLWFFNNPISTRSVQAVSSLQLSYLYLIICAVLFSLIAIIPIKEKLLEGQLNATIILNGLGFSMLITLICVNFFKDNYYIILSVIAAFSIFFSAALQARGINKVSPALYAIYGFAVLSITIAGLFPFPLAFLLLSIESLLVVSMALWFRSRFIVSMNLLMFIGLLIAYLISQKSVFGIDLSFALVALVTARIINWKKDRLEIKTELIRNIYLLIGFVMTLTSLFVGLPPQYVTFSWAMAAGLFFLLSIILHNVKYRWLAIAAMIAAAVYFFLFDLKQVGIGYRVLALLVIALISLSFSTFYAKKMKNKK